MERGEKNNPLFYSSTYLFAMATETSHNFALFDTLTFYLSEYLYVISVKIARKYHKITVEYRKIE